MTKKKTNDMPSFYKMPYWSLDMSKVGSFEIPSRLESQKKPKAVHQTTFGIPTMSDVMKAYENMSFSLYPSSRKPIESTRQNKAPPEIGLSSGLQAVENIQKSIHNLNQAYANIRGSFRRSRKNKKALGNPKEDAYHPDNMEKERIAYTDYITNPETGQKQTLEEYTQWHNTQVLAGKTPSSRHTASADIKEGIAKLKAKIAFGKFKKASVQNIERNMTDTMYQPVQVDLPQTPQKMSFENTADLSNDIDEKVIAYTEKSPPPKHLQSGKWCMNISKYDGTNFQRCYQTWDQATYEKRYFESLGFSVSPLFQDTS